MVQFPPNDKHVESWLCYVTKKDNKVIETVYVTELIRCKDCARNPEYTARTHCPRSCFMDRYMGPDGWCSFARRKNNGKTD